MGTAGSLVGRPEYTGTNYHLNPTHSKIDAAIGFATRGSVFNEVWHSICAFNSGVAAVGSYIADVDTSANIHMGFVGFNMALVALQRYNRARMLNRVNEELANGETFTYVADNWTGVDATAHENWQDAKDEQPMPSSPLTRLA